MEAGIRSRLGDLFRRIGPLQDIENTQHNADMEILVDSWALQEHHIYGFQLYETPPYRCVNIMVALWAAFLFYIPILDNRGPNLMQVVQVLCNEFCSVAVVVKALDMGSRMWRELGQPHFLVQLCWVGL